MQLTIFDATTIGCYARDFQKSFASLRLRVVTVDAQRALPLVKPEGGIFMLDNSDREVAPLWPA